MLLSEIIIDKIRKEGPLSFHDFMEMALYFPGYGYYTSSKERIGQHGDYYTSPLVTPLFGYLLAKQMEEIWNLLKPAKFDIVECGAGTGLLCSHILNALSSNKELYDQLEYYIVEKNERGKEFPTSDKVSWLRSIHQIPAITGCILSNELIDNFPVHVVVMEDELMEVFVDYKNEFIEILRPASESLRQYFEELQVHLPKGFRTEINLRAINWMADIAAALKKGFVISIDYGFPSAELYSYKRRLGTLTCYHKHQVNLCPFIHIGEQDITSHVNFSALHYWGSKNGLKLCGFTNQSRFLQSLGLCDYLRMIEGVSNYSASDVQKNTWLLHQFLMDMGQKLKVLIQSKRMENSNLSGLQLAEYIH